MASNVVIAFDLDDTLYKERDYVLNAYLKILQRYAGEVCRASENCDFGEFAKNEDVISLCQNFLAHEKPYEAFDYLAAHLPGTDVEEMKAIYRSGDIPLKDTEGACDTLAYLKDKGYTTAIITDGFSQRQRRKISALGIEHLIDHILISEETGYDKTSAIPFRRLQEKCPDAKRFVYIGDNPAKDFYHPNTMGWDTVMVFDAARRNIHPQNLRLPQSYLAHTSLMALSYLKNVF